MPAWKGGKHSTRRGRRGDAGCRYLGVLCGGAMKGSFSSAEAAPSTGCVSVLLLRQFSFKSVSGESAAGAVFFTPALCLRVQSRWE